MMGATTKRFAHTARGLMSGNPLSIHEHATLQDAAQFLEKHNLSFAPVINNVGRPIGLLKRKDTVLVSSDGPRTPQMLGDFINEAKKLSEPIRPESVAVRQVMTPVVLSVDLDASLEEVCGTMLDRKVHRLFVIDRDETLVGVISALDVLRCLIR